MNAKLMQIKEKFLSLCRSKAGTTAPQLIPIVDVRAGTNQNQMRTKNECAGSTTSSCADAGSPQASNRDYQAAAPSGFLREGSADLRGGEGHASGDPTIDQTVNAPLSVALRAVIESGACMYVGNVYLKFPEGTTVPTEMAQEISVFVNSLQLYANASARSVICSLFKINGIKLEGMQDVQIH